MSPASSRSSRPSAMVGSAARSEAPRTSWFECPSPNKGTSTSSKFSWRPAKLAPRYSHELALVYERERLRGNKNRAPPAVARKMVAYMLAVERKKQDFVPAEELGGTK